MIIAATVFIAIFAAVMLVAIGLASNPEARRKLTTARLAAISSDSALGIENDEFEGLIRNQVLSSVPWLNRFLKKIDLLGRVQTLLLQADSTWTVARFLAYSIVGCVCGFLGVYWRTGDLAPAALLALLATAVPTLQIVGKRAARMSRFEQRLPDALVMMVSAIRAGHSLLSAIGAVAKESAPPVSSEFRKCYDEQNFGMDMRVALENLAVRMPLHDVQIMVTAILIQRESGGNLAEILEKVAHVIRERFRLKRQIRVHTAQGRLTGFILALLPVLLGFGIYLVNPLYMAKLWQHPLGVKLLYTSGVMTLLGGLIIRKIVNVRI
jgi:tight adherence protein B